MFSICIFCNKPLGSNEALEAFPIGSRLAFDAARGRLWVVCRGCERWNLSPLDERWEAIEQAERLYADTRQRVATDNVGLARLRDGTTLIRIGSPMRPEFASWRYGDQFGRRRTRALLMAGGGAAALGGVIIGGAAAGVAVGSFGWMIAQVGQSIIHGSPDTVVAKVRTESHGIVHVRRRHLADTAIVPADDGSIALRLRFKNGHAVFTGREAERIAGIVVPTVNRFGGNKATVADAVATIESHGGPEAYLHELASSRQLEAKLLQRAPVSKWSGRRKDLYRKHGLFALAAPQRLALEMALHEEAERRAMQGELELLEQAWRDAEEVAAIADNLLVPAGVDDALRRLKRER